MKIYGVLLVTVVLILVLIGLIPMIGCNHLHPDELCGWWMETGYERQILFDKGGDFKVEQQPHTTIGEGTWSAEGDILSITLNSGYMNWASHTATAPLVLAFEYDVADGSLTLTEAEGIESVTYDWVAK